MQATFPATRSFRPPKDTCSDLRKAEGCGFYAERATCSRKVAKETLRNCQATDAFGDVRDAVLSARQVVETTLVSMRDAGENFLLEEQLKGGNTAASVVRLGSTVRKPMTPSTLSVHSFLRHLHAAGFSAAPEVFGIDEQGRQVLEYVPGSLWHGSRTHTQTELRRVGDIIRALHRDATSFQVPEGAQWNTRYQLDQQEIICHNDLAPWNLVCGPERWVFIDWDAAAPATRLWDLAWAAISFPPFEPGCDLQAAARAMHALLEGYHLEEASYGELIRHMVMRARAECGLIVEGAAAGQQPWVRLHAEEHHQYWGPVGDYIDRHASTLESLLISLRKARAPFR